jgi:hypothetical protein
MAPGECGRGSRAAADDTASGGTAGTGACPKKAFGFDQTQFWDSGIDSGVILGSILISFWDQFCQHRCVSQTVSFIQQNDNF